MAESAFDQVTVSRMDTTLPRLVMERFRQPMPGYVEQVFDANPGLAALGPFLPVGATILFPVLASESGTIPVETEQISLW